MKLITTKEHKDTTKDTQRHIETITTIRRKYFWGIELPEFIYKPKVMSVSEHNIPINKIKRNNRRLGEIELKINQKVIVVGNEPTDMIIGKISYFDNLDGKVGGGGALPVVKCNKKQEEFLTFGIVIPYSDEIYRILSNMESIERYNYLAHTHGQISEKYGVKYKTYPKGAEYIEPKIQKIIDNLELEYIEFINSDLEERKKLLPLTDPKDIKSLIWNLFASEKIKISYNDYSKIIDIWINRLNG